MLKQLIVYEVKDEENEVKIHISQGCPLGFIHDALYKARCMIIEKINESINQDKPINPEKTKEE